jgi:hypothetical protein
MEQFFYSCYVLVVLKMLPLQSKIHRLMPYVNDFINLLVIQTMLRTYPLNTIDQTNDLMDTCFATDTFASKVAIHCTLNMSPGALVSKRDMILNIPLVTDLLQLHEQQRIIIDE